MYAKPIRGGKPRFRSPSREAQAMRQAEAAPSRLVRSGSVRAGSHECPGLPPGSSGAGLRHEREERKLLAEVVRLHGEICGVSRAMFSPTGARLRRAGAHPGAQGQGAVIPWLTKTLIDDVIPNRRLEMIKGVAGGHPWGCASPAASSPYWPAPTSRWSASWSSSTCATTSSAICRSSRSYYEKNQAGKILARVMWDVQNVHQLFSSAFIQLISDTFAIIIFIVILFSMSAKLAFYSILVLPALCLHVPSSCAPRIRRASQDVQEKFSYIVGSVSERITGAKVVKSFHP